MNKLQYLDFFKRKAKRLLKDYKEYLSNDCIYLEPSILLSTMIEKFGDKATLMNAQHIVAQSAGFKKWEELIQAGFERLEEAKMDVEFDDDTVHIDTGNGFIGGSKDLFPGIFDIADIDTNSQTEVKPLKNFSDEEQKRILSDQPFKRNTKEIVECLHCGHRFSFEEVNVERTPGFDYIVCKYYPKDCNGSLIDLIPANELDEYEKARKTNKNP
jgi:hypothetical protein